MMNHFALLAKSLRLASQYHAQQQRKSDGSPYINHLIEVVDMLVNIAHWTSHTSSIKVITN